MPTKPILLTNVSLPFDVGPICQEKRLSDGHGPRDRHAQNRRAYMYNIRNVLCTVYVLHTGRPIDIDITVCICPSGGQLLCTGSWEDDVREYLDDWKEPVPKSQGLSGLPRYMPACIPGPGPINLWLKIDVALT